MQGKQGLSFYSAFRLEADSPAASLRKEMASMNRIARFLASVEGATAIEYGLIAALISVVIITAVTTIGVNLSGTFTTVAGSIK
jgi:pilus assembly protein Flp/PilA